MNTSISYGEMKEFFIRYSKLEDALNILIKVTQANELQFQTLVTQLSSTANPLLKAVCVKKKKIHIYITIRMRKQKNEINPLYIRSTLFYYTPPRFSTTRHMILLKKF